MPGTEFRVPRSESTAVKGAPTHVAEADHPLEAPPKLSLIFIGLMILALLAILLGIAGVAPGEGTAILRAVILGTVQGLTEFLPISSSAHLILIPWVFGWEPYGLAFDVALHLGTLTAVLIYFRRDLIAMFRGVAESWRDLARGEMPDDPMGRTGLYIIIGSIPAAIVGFLVQDMVDEFFHQLPVSRPALALSAVMLIVMGLLLGAADRYLRHHRKREIDDLRLRDALIVGTAQAFALLPGVSRSGSTITAGLFAGMSRPAAARFSFLLGIPIVLGAGLLEMVELVREGIPADERAIFAAGVITAGIVGYLAIAWLMRFLQQRTTDIFVLYRLGLGLTILLLLAAGFRG